MKLFSHAARFPFGLARTAPPMTPSEAHLLLTSRRLQVRRAASRRLPAVGPRGTDCGSLAANLSRALALVLLVTGLAMSGCKPAGSAPPPLAADVVPETLEKAFAGAPAEVASVAQAVAQAAREKDPDAVLVLMDLSTRPQLTPEQRAAASASMNGLLDQARKQAAQGDAAAAAVMEKYRASK